MRMRHITAACCRLASCPSFLSCHEEVPLVNSLTCLSLILGVRRNQGELNDLLGKTADNWSLDRMAATDRNVLRLGAYELLYTDTPGRAVINEAVELAKRYGSANSAPFVNGILDKFLNRQEPA